MAGMIPRPDAVFREIVSKLIELEAGTRFELSELGI
jgi:hypothetical protein